MRSNQLLQTMLGGKLTVQNFFVQVWGNSGKISFAPPKISLLLDQWQN